MRPELQAALALARCLPPEDVPHLLGELEEIRAVAFARLASPVADRSDESLDIAEASKRLGVSRSYLYHHRSKFKFARKEGAKLLFSRNGIDAYLKK